MRSNYFKNIRLFWRKNAVLFLSLFFIFGLFSGVYMAPTVTDSWTAVIGSTIGFRVSAVGLAASLSIPLLLSVLAVYFSVPAAILPICFFKAFAFGYCACGIHLVYQGSGWLVRLLLLFSDNLMLVPLIWLWLRHIDGTQIALKRDTMLCFFWALIVGSVDYMYISPFLALLLQG